MHLGSFDRWWCQCIVCDHKNMLTSVLIMSTTTKCCCILKYWCVYCEYVDVTPMCESWCVIQCGLLCLCVTCGSCQQPTLLIKVLAQAWCLLVIPHWTRSPKSLGHKVTGYVSSLSLPSLLYGCTQSDICGKIYATNLGIVWLFVSPLAQRLLCFRWCWGVWYNVVCGHAAEARGLYLVLT